MTVNYLGLASFPRTLCDIHAPLVEIGGAGCFVRQIEVWRGDEMERQLKKTQVSSGDGVGRSFFDPLTPSLRATKISDSFQFVKQNDFLCHQKMIYVL